MTSAVKAPSTLSTTVRQTPLTQMESPWAASLVTNGPRTVIRAASSKSCQPVTSPSSSTIPVNISPS